MYSKYRIFTIYRLSLTFAVYTCHFIQFLDLDTSPDRIFVFLLQKANGVLTFL